MVLSLKSLFLFYGYLPLSLKMFTSYSFKIFFLFFGPLLFPWALVLSFFELAVSVLHWFPRASVKNSHKTTAMCSSTVLEIVTVVQSCLTLCNPINCSMPGFPVLHYLPELVQTHVH